MIAAFTRLDLSSWFPRTQTILTLSFVVAFGILLPVPGMAIAAAALVTSLMVSAPFLGDERGRLDTLYGVLPISRRTVVIGRTLSVLTYYAVASLLATAVTVAVALVRGSDLSFGLLLIAHAAALAFVGLSMAVQLPVFFRIGYSRGRLIAYAPAFVIAGAGWLLQETGGLSAVQDALAGVPVVTLASVGVVVGVAGIVFAIVTAVRMYRTREV